MAGAAAPALGDMRMTLFRMTMFRMKLTGSLLAVALLLVSPPARAETLTDVLIAAYKNSDLLDQNRAVLKAADEDVAIALSALRPTLAFVAQANYADQIRNGQVSDPNAGFSREDFLTTSFQLSADLTLYDSGRTRLGIDVAKESVLATRDALVGVEQSVLLQAVSAYMNVRSRVEFVLLRQKNVRVIEQELRAAQDRFEVGEVTRTDVALAEARLAASRSALAAADGDLAVAREVFKTAVGAYPGTLAPPPASPATARSPDDAKGVARRSHPSILQAQRGVTIAELNVARAQAAMGPSLTAGLQLGYTDTAVTRRSANLTYRQPIYAGGQLLAVTRKARNGAEASRAQLLITAAAVSEDVGTAWAQLAVARAQIDASDRQITAAQIAYNGVREEATLGARTTLDVLDAEQELLNAQVNRIVAENTRYVAVYSLLAAMGLLTVDHLNLGIPTYDPVAHYNAVKSAPALSLQGARLDKLLRSIGKD